MDVLDVFTGTLLLLSCPAGLFFAVWGVIIGRCTDRLAKRVAKLYGFFGLTLQVPIFAAWLGGNVTADLDGIVLFTFIPTTVALIALWLGFKHPIDIGPRK